MYNSRQEWLINNPLRKWLRENDETVVGLSAIIRRNPTTIHMWLRGAITPTSSFLILEMVTGDKGIQEKWKEWLDNQPGIPANVSQELRASNE